MKTRLALATYFIFLPLRLLLAAEAPAGPPQGIASCLRPFVDRHVLAGAVTLVSTPDGTVSEAVGLADIVAGKPMRPDTLFWIASMSKPLTATALMMLVDEGKVNLDDPVEKYLPEFKGQMVKVESDADRVVLKKPTRPVTVRNVLSHTSGIPHRSRIERGIDGYSLRESVIAYAVAPLEFEPGTRYLYSSAGINTAGRIIEVVSGMPYEEFLDRRLLGPLGMKDTTLWPSEEQVQRLAKSYKPDATKTGLEETPIDRFTYPLTNRKRGPAPGGGYFSTAADLAVFCRMVLDGGVYQGRRLLSRAAVREMTSTQTGSLLSKDGDESGYGLGWSTSRKARPDAACPGRCGHGGAFGTQMTVDPDLGLIAIFLVQADGFPGPDGDQAHPTFLKAAVDSVKKVPPPPVAPRYPHHEVRHGQTVEDPYFWLREKDRAEVTAYLEAENAYTAALTGGLKPFQDSLYREMLARIQETDSSVPARNGKHYYYSRTEEGKQYTISCRKPARPDGSLDEGAAEEVLVDPNVMGRGLPFISVSWTLSDDENLLAYSTDTTGFRQYVLHVKDLRTGSILPDTAERVTSTEWAADNQTLFFTTEDEVTKRSNQLWRLRLGQKPELIEEEKDELYDIQIDRTRDKKYLLHESQSTDTWETRYLDAATPGGPFQVVLPREKDHKYSVEHRDGLFYIRSNKGAKNFRVVTAPVASPSTGNWKEFIPHRSDTLLEDLELFKDHAVAHERIEGSDRFRVFSFATRSWHEIEFAEAVHSAGPAENPEFDTLTFRFSYESLVTPTSIFDYDIQTRRSALRKREVIRGGYDQARYATERQWATGRDGVRVPIDILYPRGFPHDGRSPLWLYGYGSYGLPTDADFDSARLSLLDRGVAYAIAHIRGGNEMGELWHDEGMLMKKMNTFTDFIACADHLVAEKWTSPDLLLIEGGSAGGLLMGAVTNLRPDLFRAVHAAVPFMDVMNTMMDASLPLTTGEYLEWGDPNQKDAYDAMIQYSPYDNIAAKAYPAILVTTSLNDSQVMYWEPAKYVARLRSLKTDRSELLLKCKMEPAGHGGASGRYDRLKDRSFETAWMLKQVAITR